ncbi:exodeoxyribonuclease V subunit alpha [Buchnera aphidicola (Mindarus keteleerifoliae)]|uniref:exodeoxyribonuclease V subunit alpha n=1 Tax=Buchnera aphidicola TaxID=9 RepID=UPI0031B72715
MKKILKEAVKKKMIRNIDFYFSIFVSKKNEPAVMLAAACTSHFYGNGNACLPIKLLKKKYFRNPRKKIVKNLWKIIDFIKSTKDWINILKKSDAIGKENSNNPIILSNNSLYLYQVWKTEKKIIEFLIKNSNLEIKKKFYENFLKKINFKKENYYQKLAILMTMINKITFIIGGPGTGKTTLISKLIISIIQLSNNLPIIKLTAMTGKAASNLLDSIKKNISISNLTKSEKKCLPNCSSTLHRLLKIKSNFNLNTTQKKNIILADILIIDESSMIDFFIMNKLIQSVSESTKIIFIGDCNQLPPVGTGFLLKDISYFHQLGYTKKFTDLLKKTNFLNKKYINKNSKFIINNNICALEKNYRFSSKSGINQLALMLKLGKTKIIKKIVNNVYPDIKYISVTNNKEYKNMIFSVTKKYKKYIKNIKTTQNPKKIITLFNKYRLICVLKKGFFGTKHINKCIENKMKKLSLIKPTIINKKNWYVGKPILVKENNKNLKIFNGNIGITLLDSNKNFSVFFLSSNNAIKIVPIDLLPKYETAWTITVHKSQGSEFIHTGLLLPFSFVKTLNRELLYTAITRSKKKLTLYANKNILHATIKNKVVRYSGIIKKIQKHIE